MMLQISTAKLHAVHSNYTPAGTTVDFYCLRNHQALFCLLFKKDSISIKKILAEIIYLFMKPNLFFKKSILMNFLTLGRAKVMKWQYAGKFSKVHLFYLIFNSEHSYVYANKQLQMVFN